MRRSVEEYIKMGMDHDGYIEPDVTSLDTYPLYIEAEAKSAVERIQALKDENTFSIGFITDTHYAANLFIKYDIRLQRTLNAYREISRGAQVDFLVLGGDHTDDGTKENKMNCFKTLRKYLDGIKYFPVNGNHDNNEIWDRAFVPSEKSINFIRPEEMYHLFYDHITPEECNVGESGLYYYKDDRKKKIRSIFLDTSDIPIILDNGKLRYDAIHHYNISQEQLDWLVNKALVFDEEGWTILIFSHVALVNDNKAKLYSDGNHLIIGEVLRAYKNGEECQIERYENELRRTVDTDFSKYHRGEIAACFAGHTHNDIDLRVDGIQHIITANSIMYPEVIAREDGTKTELLFDIITLNTKKRLISLTRVGAGNDREFQY